MKINNLKQLLGLGMILSSSIISEALAQDNPFSIPKDRVINRDAELIFDNFHKFGLSIQTHYLPIYNNTTYSFKNEYPDRITWAAGIDYNFYQTRRFNFRVGAYIRNFNIAEKLDIPLRYLNIDQDDSYNVVSTDGPNWNYNLNLSSEYIAFVAKNTALNFHVGGELMYYDTGAEGVQSFTSIIIDNGNSSVTRETRSYNTDVNLTVGLMGGFGVYFRAGKTIIRSNLNYKFSLSSVIFADAHEWQNLSGVTGIQVGNHSWQGHHASLSITIHPGRKNIKQRLQNIGKNK